jgi:hypothetical protein
VVLKEDEDSWNYLVKNEDVLHGVKEENNVMYNIKRKKPNLIYKFCVETASKYVIEGKIEGTGKRGRRRKKRLDDLKDRKKYQYFKEEVLNPTSWIIRFGAAMDLLKDRLRNERRGINNSVTKN